MYHLLFGVVRVAVRNGGCTKSVSKYQRSKVKEERQVDVWRFPPTEIRPPQGYVTTPTSLTSTDPEAGRSRLFKRVFKTLKSFRIERHRSPLSFSAPISYSALGQGFGGSSHNADDVRHLRPMQRTHQVMARAIRAWRLEPYWSTSLIRNTAPVGPYSSHMPRDRW